MSSDTLITSGLKQAFTSFSGYLLAIGVIGGLTMSLLQTFKDLTPWRARFNRDELRAWLQERALTLQQCRQGHGISDVNGAELELLRLATDNDYSAFYGAELESLAAQFSGAALLVLDYPRLSGELYRLLTVHATKEDADLLLQDHAPFVPIPGLVERQYTVDQLTESAKKRHKLTETRNRIRHQVTQSIASFQVSASSKWQRKLKIWSWIVSAALTMTAYFLSGESKDKIGWALLLSAIAGFLAPIARDVLAALQRLRG